MVCGGIMRREWGNLVRKYRIVAFGHCLLEGVPFPGTWGHVIAVFDRSCYVLGSRHRLMCILDDRLDDGPINMRVQSPGAM